MAIDLSPRFTPSLRGYDKHEVDEYLESVSLQAGEAQERIQELEDRITELEQQPQQQPTARTIGEGVTRILTEAEAQAEYMLEEARQEADTLRRQAAVAAAEAREARDAAQRAADEQVQRAISDARAQAAAAVAEAEARARRRQAQIEGWAQEVIEATQADQARLAEEFAVTRYRHEAELSDLVKRREDVLTRLRDLHGALAETIQVGCVPCPDAQSPSSPEPPAA